MPQRALAFGHDIWIETKDGDPSAMAIFARHYTCRPERKQFQFVGPGHKIVLITPAADALFVWRRFKSQAVEHGINCAVFRNESRQLSSELIRAAVDVARRHWPGERLYTYVNAAKTARRRSRHASPGACFIHAGWTLVLDDDGKPKRTKRRGYHVLELPAAS